MHFAAKSDLLNSLAVRSACRDTIKTSLAGDIHQRQQSAFLFASFRSPAVCCLKILQAVVRF